MFKQPCIELEKQRSSLSHLLSGDKCQLGTMPVAAVLVAAMLTWAGSTPGGCTPCEWALAFGSARSNSDEPSCGLSSSGSRIL